MKKQFLALTLCLAVSSTSALASSAPKSEKMVKPSSSVSSAPIVKSEAQSAQPKQITKDEARKFFEAKRAKEKAMMYEALKLTQEQKTKAEALDLKAKNDAKPLMKKFHQETKKLRDLENKNAGPFAVWKQQLAVNKAKDDFKRHMVSSRKSFEAILTKDQKTEYAKIQADRKKKFEEFKKTHPMPKDFKGEHGKGGSFHRYKQFAPPPPPEGVVGPHGPEPVGPPPVDKK